jgi:predicted pyridoxine 5'-phosphate oxidase superfamily flavin-nucleotide-binding protein
MLKYITLYFNYLLLITIVKLSAEMKTVFSKVNISPVATASKDGISHVVPIGFYQLVDNETIWIEDNFMGKCLENLGKN